MSRALLLVFFSVYAGFAQSPGASVAATPPMGWNSWDSYGLTVTEDEFKANAEYAAHNLLIHGWKYMVVDEGWYLQNPEAKPGSFHFVMDGQGRYVPAVNRFSDDGAGFSNLSAWTHARGMKFGIHIIRGIPREAVDRNLPIAGSNFHAADAAVKSDTCRWNSDNFGVSATAAGQAYYDSVAALYAAWGVDFVKVDCITVPYKSDEIRMFSDALRKTGRPILLSLSPGPTPIDQLSSLRQYANMWRISDDFWDHWKQWPGDLAWSQGLLAQFTKATAWASDVEPGHWPDADMLPLGTLGPRPGFGKIRQSAFTHDEAQTLITLWAILRSPLIMGGNLTELDEWTKALLTNDDVIAVNQQSSGGHAVVNEEGKAVWVAKGESGKTSYVALFNLSDAPQTLSYPLQPLGLGLAALSARDLWGHKELGRLDELKANLPPHGCLLFRVSGR